MTKANLRRAPLVLFVRVPLLLPLWLLSRIGAWADRAGLWIGERIPGFEP